MLKSPEGLVLVASMNLVGGMVEVLEVLHGDAALEFPARGGGLPDVVNHI